jgi:hypothetical protein
MSLVDRNHQVDLIRKQNQIEHLTKEVNNQEEK